MAKHLTVLLLLVLLVSVAAHAEGWEGKSGIGIRGPILVPLAVGSDFSLNGDNYESVNMGWEGALYFEHGISEKIVLDFSFAKVRTYDNVAETGSQSFSPYNKDDASAKFTGTLLGACGKYFFNTESSSQFYFLLGFGVDIWDVETFGTDTSFWVEDFVAKTGLGVRFGLTERVSMSLEGKFSYGVRILDNSLPDDYYGTGTFAEYDYRPFRAYLEPSIGLTYHFGGDKDTDKDGVKDKKDNCPDTPLGAVVDAVGCPIDSDGDGVYDGLDKCEATPAGAIVDAYGCPLDSDGDGVFDGLDKCPDTPEKAPVDEFGCPLDSDGDGVPDYKDREPDTPKGAIVDEWGVHIDTDQDGYPDGIDQCPRNAIGLEVDETGCPKEVKKITEKITLNINYASGSYEPDQNARTVLDGVAKSLKAFPAMTITINGYTDSQGAEEFNQTLSENRAKGVMEYLNSQGIEASRMTTRGFGENPDYFVGDNETAEGRKANRRVEIESIDE